MQLLLNGWGQPADGLTIFFENGVSLDYGQYASYEELKKAVSPMGVTSVVGWSLGAQLALRLAADGAMQPREMVLIAPPYQFVADPIFPMAMPQETFLTFRRNYVEDTMRTVGRFNALIAKGDKYAGRILQALPDSSSSAQVKRWLPWFDALGHFSAESLPMRAMPACLLVHGKNDHIVPLIHSERYCERLPGAKLFVCDEAGHAPHLHDPDSFKAAVEGFMNGH